MLKESWTSQFRKDAMTRIQGYEKFLGDCGINAMAGSELEFHATPSATPVNYTKLWGIKEFEKSPLVEGLKDEEIPKVGEIVIGMGPQTQTASHPGERAPSTIARATQSAREILGKGAHKYGTDINFGERDNGKRIRSLQNNVSLWNSADKTPLFLQTSHGVGNDGLMTNELTLACAQSLLEAQKALSALVSVTPADFGRYKDKDASFGISVQNKNPAQSALLRKSPGGTLFVDKRKQPEAAAKPTERTPASLYFEDRMPSSEADPALAMLITLGGIVTGVQRYMVQKGLVDEHNQPDPQKLKAYLGSPDFEEKSKIPQTRSTHEGDIDAPWNYASRLPQSAAESYRELAGNTLAKEIMGDRFHEAYCAAYEKEVLTAKAAQGASR